MLLDKIFYWLQNRVPSPMTADMN